MLAMTRAVEALGFEPAWVLVDGNACPRWTRPSKAIVAGDAKCRSIAAASIIAKSHARPHHGRIIARNIRAMAGPRQGLSDARPPQCDRPPRHHSAPPARLCGVREYVPDLVTLAAE
jgi:hypothetical protein